jgi:protein-L-isoaspartate(D-aspartate) O-methyltransferase
MTEPNFEGIGFTSRRTRDRLIGRLEASGIRNPAVLEVMRQVPRHIFIDEALAHRAYEDSSLPIGHGQTISYQTAVLSQLADRVWTVERIGPLLTRARRHWSQLKLRNITARLGDGFEGWADRGPFDGILLAAAPRQVPPALLEQLAPGGVLVAPVGDRDEQVLERHWRDGSVLKSEVLEAVRFVPMLGGTA